LDRATFRRGCNPFALSYLPKDLGTLQKMIDAMRSTWDIMIRYPIEDNLSWFINDSSGATKERFCSSSIVVSKGQTDRWAGIN
jgi:hypothetical protein